MPIPVPEDSPRHPNYPSTPEVIPTYDQVQRETITRQSEEAKTQFSNQPRYIQFLVVLSFPIYGTCRLGLKTAEKTCEYTWKTMVKIVDTCGLIYRVCRSVYNYIAPKVWNGFIKPWIIQPIKTYIINPIVALITMIFDMTKAICMTVYDVTYQTFISIGNVWNSMWSTT